MDRWKLHWFLKEGNVASSVKTQKWVRAGAEKCCRRAQYCRPGAQSWKAEKQVGALQIGALGCSTETNGELGGQGAFPRSQWLLLQAKVGQGICAQVSLCSTRKVATPKMISCPTSLIAFCWLLATSSGRFILPQYFFRYTWRQNNSQKGSVNII